MTSTPGPLMQPMVPRERPAIASIAAPRSRRLATIDALRGVAILLMLLDHCAYFTGVNVDAEQYIGSPMVLGYWGFTLIGLLTNVAAPTFWLLSGVSIYLLSESMRRRTGSDAAATRFLLTRAAVLFAIDITLMPLVWDPPHAHIQYRYVFDLFSSLAVSMLLMSVVRFLPWRILLFLMTALLFGYQWLYHTFAPPPGTTWVWPHWMLDFGETPSTGVGFPIFGWFPLMGLGFVLGRWIDRPLARKRRTWVIASAVLLAAWFVARTGPYGTFFPLRHDQPWTYLFFMSKGPPGLDFMLFNLGGMALVMAALLSVPPAQLTRAPGSWIVICGQASLFVYVLHLFVYKFLGGATLDLLPGSPRVRYLVTWLLGLAFILPAARGYRRLKEANPGSFLRYL